MKCPSIYTFYRAYFGIPSSGKKHFALAIKDAQSLLQQTFEERSFETLTRYIDEPIRARQLTKLFLKNFYAMAQNQYTNCFETLSFESNMVTLSKDRLGTRVPLYIPFTYALEREKKTIIFFEFGKLGMVDQWQTVFQTLTSSFELLHSMAAYDRVVYWDLLKGDQRSLGSEELIEASVDKVAAAARRYIYLKGRI